MKTFTINNKKLLKLLEKKNEVVLAGREQSKKVEEEQKKLNKIGLQVQKVKDKVAPIVNKQIEQWKATGMLDEFEQVSTVEIKDGEIVCEVFDQVEEYKKALREYAKEQKDNSQPSTEGGIADDDAGGEAGSN